MNTATQNLAVEHGPRGMSPGAAALAYGCSRGTIYKLIGMGQLRSVKWFRRTIIPVHQLEALLNSGLFSSQDVGNGA